jgi:hypothetical protein
MPRNASSIGEVPTAWMDIAKSLFFVQPFIFDDGTCLAIPRGYEDVYYFPAVKNGNKTTCLVGIPTEYHVSPRVEMT